MSWPALAIPPMRSPTPVRRGTIWQVSSRPTAAQHLSDLARLRRVRDRIDREYAEPLDVEALARGVHMSAGHLSRQFRLAFGESPYGYLMTRRIERAMALLRCGDLSVTEVCSAVGCSSLGTFSTRFAELVGVPPSTYRRQAARATAGMPPCVAKQVTRPIRNREARVAERHEWSDMQMTGCFATLAAVRKPALFPCRTTSVAVMSITIHSSFLPHNDPDASLAFYRDTLGFEVRNDVGYEGMHWITVGPADQPDTSIVLHPPAATPGVTDDERRTIAEMMAKGTFAGVNLATADLDGTFAELQAHDIEVVQEPNDQPYGIRDCAVRDPAGNMIRIQELRHAEQ
jgi:AraC-like DNA-binding protein/catechol 2,3-dioxygenase-like lactoylglutathione lyase family enzyme